MSTRLLATVAAGDPGRIYVDASSEHESAAARARPVDVPAGELPEQALGFRVQLYGMKSYADLFTSRQL